MAEKIIIASDSTCDLSPELIERYGVKILPLKVSVGGNNYTDGIDVDPDMIYDIYEKTGELPKTAAINIAEFEEFFAEHTAMGSSIIVFTISSEMSSTRTACGGGVRERICCRYKEFVHGRRTFGHHGGRDGKRRKECI